jgi:hypothetical protein
VRFDFPEGLSLASTAFGKDYFNPALMEPHDLPSFSAVKICLRNKPKSSSNRQKKNKHHFRDKPAHAVQGTTLRVRSSEEKNLYGEIPKIIMQGDWSAHVRVEGQTLCRKC